MLSKSEILGGKIRSLRQKVGLTQGQLAEGIITQAQLSNIEKGRVIPLSTTLYELSERLGVNVNLFYEHAYNDQYKEVMDIKNKIRKAIRSRNYKQVSMLVNSAIDNPSFKNYREQKFLLWHKGVSDYYLKGDFKEAIQVLNSALEIKTSGVECLQDVEILNSIGILYNETSQYKNSVSQYLKALKIYNGLLEPSDKKVLIRICYGIGKSYYKLEEYQTSLQYCQEGIKTCLNEEILYLLGELYYESGQNYTSLNQLKLAYSAFNKAANIFEIESKLVFLNATKKKIDMLLR